VRDMLRILKARWPLADVVILPTSVQGADAPAELCLAFSLVGYCDGVDLVITGRGGGSMEDLWCFNDEAVARAIANCSVPVIAGVGHEPDVTIADFVADLRAATPSNAAELATPDIDELKLKVQGLSVRMQNAISRKIKREEERLIVIERSRVLRDPMAPISDKRMLLDFQRDRLTNVMKAHLQKQRGDLGRLAAGLDALSPLKVMGRGYGISRTEEGKILRSVKDAPIGTIIGVRLTDGTLHCLVKGVDEYG